MHLCIIIVLCIKKVLIDSQNLYAVIHAQKGLVINNFAHVTVIEQIFKIARSKCKIDFKTSTKKRSDCVEFG